jgi:hypothetical protein
MQHEHHNLESDAARRSLQARYIRRLREVPFDAAFRLVESTPVRTATSIGEARAAAYVDGRMRRAGLQVSADPFRTEVPPAWDSALVAVLALAGVLVYFWLPILALALEGVALAVAAAAAIRARPLLGRTRPSQNVVAIRAAAEQQRRRVVMLAPLDTPSNTLAARIFGAPQRARVAVIVALLLMVACGLIGLLNVQRAWLYLQIAAVLVPLLAAALDQWVRIEPSTPGAVNHAGALAVLVSACESIEELDYTEVWAVALGATSDGSGLRDLLRRYPFDQSSTLLIGLESLGSGGLYYLASEGWPQRRSADPELLAIAEAAAAASDTGARPAHYRGGDTLAAALARHGFRALTVASLDASGHRPRFASPLDTPERLEADLLEHAAQFAVALIEQIERAAAQSS